MVAAWSGVLAQLVGRYLILEYAVSLVDVAHKFGAIVAGMLSHRHTKVPVRKVQSKQQPAFVSVEMVDTATGSEGAYARSYSHAFRKKGLVLLV